MHMQEMRFYNKIVDKLESEDIEVTSFDGFHVNAKYGEIEIDRKSTRLNSSH